MIGKSALAILTAWAACLPAGQASAQDKGKEKTLQPRADVQAAKQVGKPGDSKTAAAGTLPSKSLSAATVDFQAELGLNFPSLLSLGARIERCRTSSPDPFGLANAARELAAAEKFTGRNASITAEQLMQEAVQMAKVRNNATELKATASLVSDKKIRAELTIAAERADKEAKQRSEQVKAGIATRGIESELIVENDSHQSVRIYYNKRYQGRVAAHGHRPFRIHDHSPHFDLTAIGSMGNRWHRHRHGHFHKYTWKISSPRRVMPLPSRVGVLRGTVHADHIDLSWSAARFATRYEIQVYDQQRGQPLKRLWSRNIRGTKYTLHFPRRGTTYEVYIRGINSAGKPDDPRSLWTHEHFQVK